MAGKKSDSTSDLKRLASGIIREQGNRFIKELLRAKGIRIGVNKTEFERNVLAAIEAQTLTLDDVAEWLADVEGWGNQHVYLYRLSTALQQDLTKPRLRRRAQTHGFSHLWDSETVSVFPDEPELTSISFDDSILRLVWQESSEGWTPVPDRNYTEKEGLDIFEYRAWRRVEQRAITRFEARVEDGLAGLFIPSPIGGDEHQVAINTAMQVVGKLMNLGALEGGRVDISLVSRNLDQGNLPTNVTPNPGVKTQKSRLTSGGSYVEFAAHSIEKAFWEEPAIKALRNSVKSDQLQAFQGAGGVFLFQPGGALGLGRPLRVQLHGKENRVRLWAQMDVGEVWSILRNLSTYQ